MTGFMHWRRPPTLTAKAFDDRIVITSTCAECSWTGTEEAAVGLARIGPGRAYEWPDREAARLVGDAWDRLAEAHRREVPGCQYGIEFRRDDGRQVRAVPTNADPARGHEGRP